MTLHTLTHDPYFEDVYPGKQAKIGQICLDWSVLNSTDGNLMLNKESRLEAFFRHAIKQFLKKGFACNL